MPIEVETDEKGKRKCVTKTEKWNNFWKKYSQLALE